MSSLSVKIRACITDVSPCPTRPERASGRQAGPAPGQGPSRREASWARNWPPNRVCRVLSPWCSP